MDFTTGRTELLVGIDKCAIAVPGNHASVGFNVMRIDARKGKKGDKLKFVAVGETAAVDTTDHADVKEPGTFNVLPKRLRDIVTSMPQGKMQVSLKGTRVTVKSLVSKRKATFENMAVDGFTVDDPGQGAPWIEMEAKELGRVLRIARPLCASTIYPDACLLVPAERGLSVFACNGQMVAVVETKLRVIAEPIILPGLAIDVLEHMEDADEQVRVFANERRVYLENCDTLVSAALPASYPFLTTHQHLEANVRGEGAGNARMAGPTFDAAALLVAVKGVLALGGFADKDEREKGMGIDLGFGHDTVVVQLALGIADARDEIPTSESGGEFDVLVDSGYLIKLLGALSAAAVTKSFVLDGTLILQSQGVTVAVATRERK